MNFSIPNIVLVGLGGCIGSIGRYVVSGWVYHVSGTPSFPWGTAVVNIVGCFVIGALTGLADVRQVMGPEARAFALIGVLGGFTTFSTFGYETISLLRDGQSGLALANVGLQVIAGLVAVWLGLVCSRLIAGLP